MRFARAWFRAPLRTGAVAPSSIALARAMAGAAAPGADSRVVELGPGTGIVTRALIEAGVREEHLTLVELGPDFRKLLAARYPRARILDADAFEVLGDLQASGEAISTVVSSLPLLLYPRPRRMALRDDALGLVGPEGRLVQFTYGVVPPIPGGEGVRATRSRRIWANVPSAVVWTYQARA